MGAGTTDPSATTTNIARLLQSLDSDGNPDNGIIIPDAAAATTLSIDFNTSIADFENNPDVINLVANSGSVTTALISADAANQHLSNTIGAPVPTPQQPTDGFTQEMLLGRYIIPDANLWDTTQLNIYRFDSPGMLTVLGTPGGILRWGEFPWSVGADSVVIVDFNDFEEGARSGYALESVENDVLNVRVNFLSGGAGEVVKYTLSRPLTTGDLSGKEITVNASAGQGVFQYDPDGSYQLINSSGENENGTYSQHPVEGITLQSNGSSYSEIALASGTLDSGVVLKWDYELDGFIQIRRLEFFRTNGNTWDSIVTRQR